MAKGFENIESVFGKVNAEWENPTYEFPPLLPFLYHVHGLDSKHLRIHVTDFKSYTWESTKSLIQLEDMKDDIGLGGSWDEFIDYLMKSINSDNVKIVLDGSTVSASDLWTPALLMPWHIYVGKSSMHSEAGKN
ncbi:U2 small nuclear ribonucleoprotein auxiliary factor-like protein [Thalictrum thalictroides]|uniref:U2 small nuclear ribonucleoprotein auxiliary factor-like protein n=1 Tax=Thalictrum thalictroides TaxID=46969 RepID=A0A7J6W0X1_THATH|nr:U2 small nuclear ribonucleoprotein auxiliary factor-like protein [Thalictrum thalictroides]